MNLYQISATIRTCTKHVKHRIILNAASPQTSLRRARSHIIPQYPQGARIVFNPPTLLRATNETKSEVL